MKVLWAVKIGKPDWCEEVLTEVESAIPEVMALAKINGYNRFRIATYNDIPEYPDFVKTIKV